MSAPLSPPAASPSAERRRGYGRWKGERSAFAWRWWVIARANLSLAWASRWVKALLILSLVPGVILGGITYFFIPLSAVALEGLLRGCVLFAFLVAALVGSRLVSEDRRQGAFLAHFSRPVTRFDYVFGKYVALVIPLLFVTTGSGLLALGADMAVTNETLSERLSREQGVDLSNPSLDPDGYLQRVSSGGAFQAVLAWGLVVSLTTAGIMLGISALADRARIAGVIWFAIAALGEAARGILVEELDVEWPALLSWNDNISDLAAFLLAVDGQGQEFNLVTRIAVLALFALMGVALVHERVRRAEEGDR